MAAAVPEHPPVLHKFELTDTELCEVVKTKVEALRNQVDNALDWDQIDKSVKAVKQKLFLRVKKDPTLDNQLKIAIRYYQQCNLVHGCVLAPSSAEDALGLYAGNGSNLLHSITNVINEPDLVGQIQINDEGMAVNANGVVSAVEFCNILDRVSMHVLQVQVNVPEEPLCRLVKQCQLTLMGKTVQTMRTGYDLLSSDSYAQWKDNVLLISSLGALLMILAMKLPKDQWTRFVKHKAPFADLAQV